MSCGPSSRARAVVSAVPAQLVPHFGHPALETGRDRSSGIGVEAPGDFGGHITVGSPQQRWERPLLQLAQPREYVASAAPAGLMPRDVKVAMALALRHVHDAIAAGDVGYCSHRR